MRCEGIRHENRPVVVLRACLDSPRGKGVHSKTAPRQSCSPLDNGSWRVTIAVLPRLAQTLVEVAANSIALVGAESLTNEGGGIDSDRYQDGDHGDPKRPGRFAEHDLRDRE